MYSTYQSGDFSSNPTTLNHFVQMIRLRLVGGQTILRTYILNHSSQHSTKMGSPLNYSTHSPLQHHKSIKLKVNNLYVAPRTEDRTMKFSFAHIITMICT